MTTKRYWVTATPKRGGMGFKAASIKVDNRAEAERVARDMSQSNPGCTIAVIVREVKVS